MSLDLGSLFTTVDMDLGPFEQKTAKVATELLGLRREQTDVKIGADASGLGSVVDKAMASVRELTALDPTVTVTGDVGQATSALAEVESEAGSLPDAEVKVTADDSAAKKTLEGIKDTAASAGQESGDAAGQGLVDGVTDKTSVLAGKGGPIVGSVIGAIGLLATLSPGVLLMDAITKGMDSQATKGLFSARTGLDAESAAKFGRAAGESYAANFGESIEGNLEAARAALGTGLLGGDATQGEITAVINSLTTVADILGEEVPAVARAAAQAIKTGMADDAAGAFDLLVKAQQSGLNASEDLLDTFNEYGTQFRKIGLEGPEAVGLMAQAVQAGARDTDLAADALKEFSIRAVDGSKLSAEGFAAIGLSAEDMTAKIAAGGDGAKEGLDQVLDGLRAIEDPVTRDAAAVALFGTQAEDLGAALYAMDASTAVDQLGQVAGAADKATAAIGANPAAALEQAKRSISVSAQGIQEALAVAFGPQIGNFATYVSTHREEIVGFMFEAGDAAFSLGQELGTAAAKGLRAAAELVEGFGTVGTRIGDVLGGILAAAEVAFGWVPGVGEDIKAASAQYATLSSASEESSKKIADGLRGAADGIDGVLVPALGTAREKFSEFGIPAVTQAALADATARASSQIAEVGVNADGTNLQIDELSTGFDRTSGTGKVLDEQLRSATTALKEQLTAAQNAGAGTDELTATFDSSRESLIAQIEQLGFSRQAAEALVAQYGLVPELVGTTIDQPGMPEARDAARRYDEQIRNIPEGTSTEIKTPGLTEAQVRVDAFRRAIEGIPSMKNVTVTYNEKMGTTVQRGDYGGRITERASGGPFLPGGPLLVGERGPELLWPDVGGFVANNRSTLALLNANPAAAVPSMLPAAAGQAVGSAPAAAQVVTAVLAEEDRALLRAAAGRPVQLLTRHGVLAAEVREDKRDLERGGGTW